MARDSPDPRERRERRRRDSSYDANPHQERRRRKGHRATDSTGELLPRHRDSTPAYNSASESPSPRKHRSRHSQSATPSGSRSSGAPLSLEALSKLDKNNAKKGGRSYDYDSEYLKEVREKERRLEKERVREEKVERKKHKDTEREAEKERRRVYEVEIAAEQARKARERRAYESEKEERRARKESRARAYESEREASSARKETRNRAYESDYAEEEARRMKRERRKEQRLREHTDHEWDEREERRRRYEETHTPSEVATKKEKKRAEKERRREEERKKRRVVSGPLLEEGGNTPNEKEEVYEYMMEKRGGAGSSVQSGELTDEERRRKKRKRIFIIVAVILILLAIIIPVAIVVSKKNSDPSTPESSAMATTSKPSNSNLNGVSHDTIPQSAQGTYLDPFTWYDTMDFNVTYTDATVGGLPIMGLNSTWDDSPQANENVPALKDSFDYGNMPIRGMNVGGWLSIEPFITPSFFSGYSTHDNVIDEYTLTSKLGSTKAASTLEQHYSAFVNAQTFADIRAAGFDHVRIPFSYWAVTTYQGDPYVPKISWRYLLRGIEYARQNGLRVNLDLHALPGSQNGWNHSGRQGVIGWLNGTDGDLNAQRSLDIHNQLSTFFAQPRYKNVVTMYGLANEPRMVVLDTAAVLNWTQSAITLVRKNNITAVIVFGDGFMGLDNWQGKLQTDKSLLLDVHQYVIFNTDQIALDHSDKLNFACKGWTAQSKRSMDKTTGFGPTMCGEWSQADTDCTQYINDVGVGSRWEGNMNTGNTSTSVLTPMCPTKNSPTCDCTNANADPSSYSAVYKKWLLQFAQAQMESFEAGWGWFYWTWETEKATQWSWRLGAEAGILPKKAFERSFSCNDTVGDFGKEGLPEYY